MKFILRLCRRIKRKLREVKFRKWREHIISKGNDYPNDSFFVLRRYSPHSGIGSHIIVFLGMLKYMENQYPKAIPIIDLKNCLPSIADTRGRNDNAWELFFEQPNNRNIGIDNISRAKNIILSDGYSGDLIYNLPSIGTFSELDNDGWSEIFNKYFHLNKNLENAFNKKWIELSSAAKKVLGVKVRGTDYNALKPKGHYIQPTVTDFLERCERYLDTHSTYTHIYLATEDEEILQRFIQAFGCKLLYLKKFFSDYSSDKMIVDTYKKDGVSKEYATTTYLNELFCLSRCDSLMTGKNSGVVLSQLWNCGKYEDEIIIDYGTY